MTDLEKAARTALKGLAASGDFLFNWHDCDPDNAAEMQAYTTALAAVTKATIALEEALDALTQEPVGQLMEEAYGRGQVLWFRKPHDLSMLYTSPPSKPWVDLTQEEVEHLCVPLGAAMLSFAEVARVVAAKLKEKNT